MVAKQQEEIKELKELHSRSFASLQHQLSGISAPVLEELKAMSLDQRILLFPSLVGKLGSFISLKSTQQSRISSSLFADTSIS